jgi:hypothetical protein
MGSTNATRRERTGEGMKGIRIGAVVALLMTTACSSARPVLYPNAQLQSVGKEAAEQDIEACKQSAESAGADERNGGTAGRVATGTAVGAGSRCCQRSPGGSDFRSGRARLDDRGGQRSGLGPPDGIIFRCGWSFPAQPRLHQFR